MFVSKEKQIDQDWSSLAEYLANQGMMLDLNTKIKQFSAGAANMNYLINLDGKKAVLRCPPKDSVIGAKGIAREHTVLSRLSKYYPYAPMSIHYCEDDSAIGIPFCISEFREGVPILKYLPDELVRRPDIGGILSRLTLKTLAELHAIDPEKAGLSDLGNPSGYLERQVEGWYKRGEQALSENNKKLSRQIVSWLRENLPTYRPISIVHNDFKLDNMLIDTDSLQVNAVLDWDMCTIGDPLFDLIITLLYWGQENDRSLYRSFARMPFNSENWFTRNQAYDYYISHSTHEPEREALQFYCVLSLFRGAVVYAQLVVLLQLGLIEPKELNKENVDDVASGITEVLEEALLQSSDFSFLKTT